MEVRDFLRQRVGGELTEAEERILREMGEGKVIDFLGEQQVDMRQKAHREAAQAWGSAQRVRAEFLYWLVIWPDFQRLIHPKGLALRGVHVEGKLDFEGAQLLHRLFIEDSYVSGGLSLVEARARTLSLKGSYLPGLWARRARIEGDLRLESALIEPPQPPQPLEVETSIPVDSYQRLKKDLVHKIYGHEKEGFELEPHGKEALLSVGGGGGAGRLRLGCGMDAIPPPYSPVC
jgi:hypothetical protein